MNESSLMRTGLHYGSLSGLAIFGFYLAVYLAGYNIFGGVTMLNVWIPVVFIVLATRHQRDRIQGGLISYGQAFATGMATTFFSATLFGLSFYLMGKVFDHSLLDVYKIQAEMSMEEGKEILSEALLEKAMESIDLVTMESLAFSEAFNKMVWGGIVTLVTAGMMRKKDDGQPTTQNG
jgi:uncharacterized membrane-anchored protein YitT (DUF2179 family)